MSVSVSVSVGVGVENMAKTPRLYAVVTPSYSICAVISIPRPGIGEGKMASMMVHCFKQ